jgi:sulfoxide reductase heme-binding subunit YedZ
VATERFVSLIRLILFLLCLTPFFWLLFGFLTESLGVSPVDVLTRSTGHWAVRLLLGSLTVSPLVRLTGWKVLIEFRRPLGLFSLLYAGLHFLTYVGYDHLFRWSTIAPDISTSRHIPFGLFAFLMLLLLGVASIRPLTRGFGGRFWRSLSYLTYAGALGAALHYTFQAKLAQLDLTIYTVWLGALFLFKITEAIYRRVIGRRQARQRQ